MNTHSGPKLHAAIASAAVVLAVALSLAGGKTAEPAWAGDSFACGLLKQWEVEHAFEWPVEAPLTCEIDEGPLGQWAVQCDETPDPVACDEASEITAVETNSFRIDRSAAGDRYLKRFRRNATETIL